MIESKNIHMLISRYTVFLSVVLIVTGSVVAVAGVVDGPPPPGGPAIGLPRAPYPLPAERAIARPLPGTRIEAQIAYIKTALKLTDRQMPAWLPVADALRTQAGRMDAQILAHRAARDHAEGAGEAIDAMTRMEEHQRALSAEADDLAKLLAVVKPFYAVLTAEQRLDADELLPLGPPIMGPPMPGRPMPIPPPFIHPFD